MADETSTITIKKSTKTRLESLKGKKDWNTFLEEMYAEKRKKNGVRSLAKLRELLNDRDLDRISATSKKFRRNFKLR